jgi:hypothetical protein
MNQTWHVENLEQILHGNIQDLKAWYWRVEKILDRNLWALRCRRWVVQETAVGCVHAVS